MCLCGGADDQIFQKHHSAACRSVVPIVAPLFCDSHVGFRPFLLFPSINILGCWHRWSIPHTSGSHVSCSSQGSLSVPVMFHIPMVEWPVGKVIPLFLGHVSSAVRQPFLSRRCDRHNPGGEGGGRGCLWYDGTNPHRRHKPIDETNQVDARTLAPRRMPQEMRSDACAARWRRATHGRSRAEENARQRWKRRIATATGTCVHQKRRDPTPWLLATCQKTSVPCAAHRWSAAASAAHRWIG